ncbi:MAG: hypothetical protein KDB53_12870, partial [Planctomycetes bacterium]|nr:hypothetical protein [Planctomycetota bacterium]
MPDETLISRARAGDAEAIDELLARHLPAVEALLRVRMGRRLRAKESLRDLAQSVMREAIVNLDRFRSGGDDGFRRWLLALVFRKIADRQEFWEAAKRDHRRDQNVDDESHARGLLEVWSGVMTPSRHAMAREELERLERSMGALSDDDRDLIVRARLLG